MPLQFDAATPDHQYEQPAEVTSQPVTLAGLFESDLDAAEALRLLRKRSIPPEAISVMVQVSDSDEDTSQAAVARAIACAGLQQFADWLMGFASVIVPERGTVLVAGPLGASLAGDRVAADIADEHGALAAVLAHFGFTEQEATYMQSRLDAGSYLISVTSTDPAALESTAAALPEASAVYVPHAATEHDTANTARALLDAPPETSTDGDVIVTDAVARFYRYCESGQATAEYVNLRGRHVVDDDGEDVGEIVDFIAERVLQPGDERECEEVRYAIVALGGILGIGRHRAAIPIAQFDLTSEPVRVRSRKEMLRGAPHYDMVAPFSRREERAVCDYFGTTPYWQDDEGAAREP